MPDPKGGLVALLVDSQYFSKGCLIVPLGGNKHGKKHVLGLCKGFEQLGRGAVSF